MPTKTVPSRGGCLDSDAKNLRNRKTAKTKTKAPNKSSGTSVPPPTKRARVTVEDIQDEDDIISAPSNPSYINTADQQESNSHSATARRSNAKVRAPWYSANDSLIYHL